MKLRQHLPEVIAIQVSVNLGSRDAFVPEHLLHLAQVGARRVAAVGVLIEQHRIAQLLQPRRRLAGVAGVDPVVLGRGVDEDLRIGLARPQVLIGRILLDPGALLRNLGIAVLADPAGPGQQAVKRLAQRAGALPRCGTLSLRDSP